jgi:hypothetical protein
MWRNQRRSASRAVSRRSLASDINQSAINLVDWEGAPAVAAADGENAALTPNIMAEKAQPVRHNQGPPGLQANQIARQDEFP